MPEINDDGKTKLEVLMEDEDKGPAAVYTDQAAEGLVRKIFELLDGEGYNDVNVETTAVLSLVSAKIAVRVTRVIAGVDNQREAMGNVLSLTQSLLEEEIEDSESKITIEEWCGGAKVEKEECGSKSMQN